MKIYLAPMEGITGYVYRNAIHKIYGGIDKFFTPFIVPTIKREFKSRELRDIEPANNQGMNVVPQILSNDAEGFMNTLNNLKKYGYKEVNLNLGCPSGTVVSKGKGSGALADLEKLDRFLDEIYSASDIAISIKTRIGMENEEDWISILEVYNKYPISELIVHPRLRVDYYKNPIHMNCYEYAYKNSRITPCYNGDINNYVKYNNIVSAYSDIPAVMIGRGMIEKPYLARDIKGQKKLLKHGEVEKYASVQMDVEMQEDSKSKSKKEELFRFHDELFQGYLKEMQEENNVLHKMKEMWFYLGNDENIGIIGNIENFNDHERVDEVYEISEVNRLIKKLKKSKNINEYNKYIEELRI